MLSLDQTKQHLRNLITGELTKVFEEIKAHVPEKTKKFDTFLILQGRYADFLQKVQRGVISSEEQRLETNRIREQLLVWIDGLEGKDLETGGKALKKNKGFPILVVFALLLVIAIVWRISQLASFGSVEKKESSGVDTASREVILTPDSTANLHNEPEPIEKQQEDNNVNSGQSSKKAEENSIEVATVEIQLLVDALWKDSEIKVNGKAVAPLKRLGTLITLALPPGSHEIQLISGGDRCVKRILVRDEGQRISVVCG